MKTFNAIVTMLLVDGFTDWDAGIRRGDVGSREYKGLVALNPEAAVDLALNNFHGEVQIGQRSRVLILAEAKRARKAPAIQPRLGRTNRPLRNRKPDVAAIGQGAR